MSWWSAQYTNNQGEYEITFGTKDYKKVKAVEKVCCAVIDKNVNSPDDVEIVRHGRWELKRHKLFGNSYDYVCSACGCDYALAEYNYCPHCGAKMDGDSHE